MCYNTWVVWSTVVQERSLDRTSNERRSKNWKLYSASRVPETFQEKSAPIPTHNAREVKKKKRQQTNKGNNSSYFLTINLFFYENTKNSKVRRLIWIFCCPITTCSRSRLYKFENKTLHSNPFVWLQTSYIFPQNSESIKVVCIKFMYNFYFIYK